MLIDANVILRYILEDIPVQSEISKNLIENKECTVLNEVLAEVIYVLEKVYKIQRNEISSVIINLINYSNILMSNKEVVKSAVSIFANKNIDFIDALLCSYNWITGKKVFTFDKKLQKLLIN
jgi:predicted nucleic-acid-binding protein